VGTCSRAKTFIRIKLIGLCVVYPGHSVRQGYVDISFPFISVMIHNSNFLFASILKTMDLTLNSTTFEMLHPVLLTLVLFIASTVTWIGASW
ncbi:hypothetical protein L9F63_019136, partial [Diploptera punctata]